MKKYSHVKLLSHVRVHLLSRCIFEEGTRHVLLFPCENAMYIGQKKDVKWPEDTPSVDRGSRDPPLPDDWVAVLSCHNLLRVSPKKKNCIIIPMYCRWTWSNDMCDQSIGVHRSKVLAFTSRRVAWNWSCMCCSEPVLSSLWLAIATLGRLNTHSE